ncbi:Asp-tRNA(Asn)/Glu-tRNA(Gln) amidotransferase subunit GatA [Spiribacter vilamensis]|uniref:Glutamyl-tRNA(Gln) amidotransferase subunit A n=1 Tax=Spiribacter vilamensis TaxID=531306 RepID=A0A4Q8CY15_9GAMM|nr:Asp-tRNA(Asn)/Glu-tRNA(Gln) amidotransferase subunit GatA [Spiribacter vilamensis]RZU97848.1 aspartyl/glutamyl-tRNA(Asn/Gln) amidotransferase subunit A [Spiribacter vilamensis]TVO61230.1 Asp-tRNA(Asn)/Glu-tRNA(Gln) amidotransferase subunit GatA [Spiribacter vilamensis]
MHDRTIAELGRALEQGECSSVELTRATLERIEQAADLNAFITLTPDSALAEAEAADAARARGEAGPLTGIPIAHKDIFCTRGVRTSCGSRMLEGFVPPYDAFVVEQLRAAGAVTVGKTNMDEFAMGSSNETSFFGPVKNPWDRKAVPGGSSGGSAAAVASGLVPAATGTDTGGSIRQPAALTGISGLKPTYGRVSRYGIVAFASSLDQAGPMASSAEDLAIMLRGMAGFDRRDSTCVDRAVPDYRAALAQTDVRGLRVGLPKEFIEADGVDAEVSSAVTAATEALREAGAEVREISLPNAGMAVPVYYVIAPAEASSNLSRFDGVRYGYRCDSPADLEDLYKRSRGEGFGEEVKRRIMVGTYALSAGYYDAYYRKAQQVRRLVQQDFARAFESVDVIAGPTSPSTAFPLGSKADDPVQMYLSDIFTIAVNLAGLPALSIPAGFGDGRPVGLQLIGNHFEEGRLLGAAHGYQQLTDWHRQRPSVEG